MNSDHTIWTEKHRPTTLDQYVGNDLMKAKLGRFIASGDVPHLLFSGSPGTGKTTAAKIIANSIDADVMYINASDENSVDIVRNKIKSFASSVGFKDLKIVLLDECDYLTPNGQAALRNLMETFSKHTRFILTCNYIERIIDPIISRTQQFQVTPPSKGEVAKHINEILKIENIAFDLLDLKILIDAHYPDIRKIINECQLYTSNGELVIDQVEIIESDFKLKVLEILKSDGDKKKKFQEIRQLVANNKVRDFTDLYTFLFQNVDKFSKNTISECILVLAEGQYRDVHVVDKEICFMATVVQLLQTTK